jgi:hypothetical protein
MRASSLYKLQVFVQDRRKKLHDLRTRLASDIQKYSPDPKSLRVEYLAQSSDNDSDIQTRLPRLVKNQAQVFTELSKENQYKILHLQRITNGYHHNLKPCSTAKEVSNAASDSFLHASLVGAGNNPETLQDMSIGAIHQ